MHININATIKTAFHKRSTNNIEYLHNMRNAYMLVNTVCHAYDIVTAKEYIKWQCAVCQCDITINAANYVNLQHSDFLCNSCKDSDDSSAKTQNIIKSSNNLMVELQALIMQNYNYHMSSSVSILNLLSTKSSTNET